MGDLTNRIIPILILLGIVLSALFQRYVPQHVMGTFLGALKIALGIKNFCIYIAFIMLFSLATGAVVDSIL